MDIINKAVFIKLQGNIPGATDGVVHHKLFEYGWTGVNCGSCQRCLVNTPLAKVQSQGLSVLFAIKMVLTKDKLGTKLITLK